MDSIPPTSLDGSWRSDHIPLASSSKHRSHTVPIDYTFGHYSAASSQHHRSDSSDHSHGHEHGQVHPSDEASTAWSSALPATAERAGSSSSLTWPRYAAPASAAGSSLSRSSLAPYVPAHPAGHAHVHGHGHGHEKHASTSSSLNGANVWGQGQQSDAFPGTGYPLVQMPSAQSAIDMKGKGRAIEEEGDGEDADMGVTGRIQVWANVMDTSKGRDKVLKCGQYSMRTYLYLLTLILRVRPLPPWFKSNRKRVQFAVSGLSLTRKCLLLLNPLHPIADLLSPKPATASEILLHLIDLASAISDDLFCLSKLGLVSRRLGKKADLWSNRLWLLSTIIGLYKLHMTKLPKLRAKLQAIPQVSGSDGAVAKQRREAERGLKEAVWANRKYLADLVFVSYDIWDVSWFDEPVKCVAGLIAAFISTSKIYDTEYIASQGK